MAGGVLALLGSAGPVAAQASPRAGGELIFVVPAEPPSYDAHREETFAVVHPAAPHYNTLLRVDPADRTGTRIVGDLAASWTAARDGRTYTFTLRRGVRFHDGSELTSADVKASYDKIIFPPAGVVSNRQGEYRSVEAVEAPDPSTVVFRLKWPAASFVASLASPFNWIYKADILARDVHWYEKNVMGTGPFLFVEYVRGALHLHVPVASHRPAQRPRAGLDDHAEPLPEQSARHGVAGGVSGPSAAPDRERVDSTHRPSEHQTLYLLPGGFFRAPSPRPSDERNTI